MDSDLLMVAILLKVMAQERYRQIPVRVTVALYSVINNQQLTYQPTAFFGLKVNILTTLSSRYCLDKNYGDIFILWSHNLWGILSQMRCVVMLQISTVFLGDCDIFP